MEQSSNVARFIAQQIDAVDKTQKQIAREVGFPQQNIVSMIKSGETKLPIAKAPAMARALGVDPQELVVMCLKEYQPEIWEAMAPLLDLSVTPDERRMLDGLRRWVGVPFLSCLDEASKGHLDAFMQSLRASDTVGTLQ